MTIALATLPADRYVGLLAGPNLGTLVTRPVVFSGSKLLVDMAASLPGKASHSLTQRKFDEADLRVAVLDEWGGDIAGLGLADCKMLSGRGVQEANWNGGDLRALEGKAVRLRFEYRSAALYGFQCA
jgi:hypothetical protein